MVKSIKNPASLQNIHFGKILLALVLIFTMVLGNVKPVKADEPYGWEIVAIKEIPTIPYGGSYLRNPRVIYSDNSVYAAVDVIDGYTDNYLKTETTSSVIKKNRASYKVELIRHTGSIGNHTILNDLKLLENVPPNSIPTLTISIPSENSYFV